MCEFTNNHGVFRCKSAYLDINFYLIKTDDIQRTTGVDTVGADTEYIRLLQTTLCVNNANCHGGRKCRWHDDCN